jgi:hypothetical protein
MKRSALHRLHERVPVEIGQGVTCVVVPSEMAAINSTSEEFARDICRRVFVEIQGVEEDDGTPAVNSFELRYEFFTGSTLVKTRVLSACHRAQESLFLGEGGAASG